MNACPDPKYQVDPANPLRFRIDNYSRARPFASFFPGIAGAMGVPLWAFYVNRGQAVASFGLQDKDGAIQEFQPANKSYRLTQSTGFRTFLRWTRGREAGFYEPFRDTLAGRAATPARHMSVSPWDLQLEERNDALGITTRVRYFTIPNEPMAGLARELVLTNSGPEPLSLQLTDGLPQFMPFGLNDFAMKNMSRTIEAWYTVDNLAARAPYARLKVTFADTAEVRPIHQGHAWFAILSQGGETRLLDPVVDPLEVFGQITDFDFPERLVDGDFVWSQDQQSGNRTPSALAHGKLVLAPGGSVTLHALYAKADSLADWNARFPAYADPAFFAGKAEENERLIRQLMDRSFVVTANSRFNAYAGQNFLDNVLRGGFPYTISDGERRDVLYLYSRRHGDTERDYNQFRLAPTYFSQGNGAYRDINQNRRNDVWFNPDVGASNIEYFINLIQLDGYNPQVIKGQRYLLDRAAALPVLERLLPQALHEEVLALLARPWIPDTLIRWAERRGQQLQTPLFELVAALALVSRKTEEAEHGDGFWTDHWFYNLDLIESYEALFPDRMSDLLGAPARCRYFDNAVGVLPRARKYLLTENGPRQYEALELNEAKAARIAARSTDADSVRTADGCVYRCSLISKLVLLATLKLASLDPAGMGIEMEADKPDWNDSINGLPGLFGSSISESLELLRLLRLIGRWSAEYGLAALEIRLPEETAALLDVMRELVAARRAASLDPHAAWSRACDAREAYRERILEDISGRERVFRLADLLPWIADAAAVLEEGIERAYDPALGIYTTYWIFDLVEFEPLANVRELHGKALPTCRPIRFEARPVAPYLEGNVHALRVLGKGGKALAIAQGVKRSELFDAPLGMYKVSGSTARMPLELGRLQAFTPGWLENESIFLHMSYKYLLELQRAGLHDVFWHEALNGLIPWRKPEQYGRSIFENVSFLASSANPDPRLHGNGYSARLSGSTCEFYNMLLLMMFGERPFRLGADGVLELALRPALPGNLFLEAPARVERYRTDRAVAEPIELATGSLAFSALGDCLFVFENPRRLDSWGQGGVVVQGYRLEYADGRIEAIPGPVLRGAAAESVRYGAVRRLTVRLDR